MDMEKVNKIIKEHNEKLDAMTEEERVAYYESFGFVMEPKTEEKHFSRIINEEYVKRRLRNGEITLDRYHDAVQKSLNCIKAALEGSTINYNFIPEDIKRKKWVANAYYTGYIKDQEKEAEREEQEMLKYHEYESYYPEYLDIEYEENQAWKEYREEDRIQEEIDKSWDQLDREDYFNQTNYPEYVLMQNAIYEAKQNKESIWDAIIDVVSSLDDDEYNTLINSLKTHSISMEFLNQTKNRNTYIDQIIDDQRKQNSRERT